MDTAETAAERCASLPVARTRVTHDGSRQPVRSARGCRVYRRQAVTVRVRPASGLCHLHHVDESWPPHSAEDPPDSPPHAFTADTALCWTSAVLPMIRHTTEAGRDPTQRV